ncbi:hypothetical protein [Streptomyces sp. NPDC001315]|uniref:hypothetical protein n=1 Tax=Streptomyces sp. NPDC001315 TaxID=3364562 RepID=UPI003682E028
MSVEAVRMAVVRVEEHELVWIVSWQSEEFARDLTDDWKASRYAERASGPVRRTWRGRRRRHRRTRCVAPGSGANAGDQRDQHRSEHAAEQQRSWMQDSLLSL